MATLFFFPHKSKHKKTQEDIRGHKRTLFHFDLPPMVPTSSEGIVTAMYRSRPLFVASIVVMQLELSTF